MQRRAAAVYFGLFVLLAVGAYGFLQVGMAEPTADFDAEAYSQGDELSAGGTTYSVSTVEAETTSSHGSTSTEYTLELAYTNETSGEEETVAAGQGDNVTLGDAQHLVYFPSDSEVYVLPTDEYLDDYKDFQDTQANFQERKAGFWGVVYISLLGGLVLLMSAYLPVKG